MKKRLFYPALLLAGLSFFFHPSYAQCPGGFTQAQLNWDNLDYFYFSGNNAAPYGHNFGGSNNYISNAMEQTQRFAIGTTFVSVAVSAAGVVRGENNTHVGEIAGFTGDDAYYVPTANNQTITLTFAQDVANVRFTLYDVDRSQRINFSALNGASVAQNINVVTYASSILTINNNNQPNANILASNTAVATNENRGTATITISGPVRTVTISVADIGTDAEFWLSDIQACVTGSFPTNWHQGFGTRPLVGPTQNQPDYFIVTPDNKSVYMMDPATGRCWFLFSETAPQSFVNSFGYDPANKYLYYVLDGTSPAANARNNRILKRYDFNTETIQTVVADLSATLNIPMFDQGVESAAASFYDGKLYLGIEGGRHGSGGTTVSRESVIWAINFDASQNPVSANQVCAFNAYRTATDSTFHDWADFVIKNGVVYNYNTARAGSSPVRYRYSAYHHYNLMTGNIDAYYQNPSVNIPYTGQSGMNWQGQLFFVRDSVGLYNENGTNSSTRFRAVVQTVPGEPAPPAWMGGAGDASEAFRPKCDFGDAPASYDPYATPATQSPAVHERSELIRLGATWTREFWKRGTSTTEDSDDGLAYTPFLPPGAVGSAYADVTVFNNSGANATLIAWLDFNGNGVFDASEAITPITVPSSASNQNFHLFWPSTPNTFSLGDSTYMRIRITAASAGMTASHATGYFTNGEVEDYKVYVDNFPLTTHFMQFEALAAGKKALLNWKVAETSGTRLYQIERSPDNRVWSPLAQVPATGLNGTAEYQYQDPGLSGGTYYYRIIQLDAVARPRYSEVRKVSVFDPQQAMRVYPNPAREQVNLELYLSADQPVTLSLVSQSGVIQLTRVYGARSGFNRLPLDLPVGLPMGWYILRVNYADVSLQQKILISK